jgi:hypothetical protein
MRKAISNYNFLVVAVVIEVKQQVQAKLQAKVLLIHGMNQLFA